jgi:hypothetical protein
MIIEVRPNKCEKMAVVLCYKPPDDDVGPFVKNFDSTLTKLHTVYNQLLVIGDFNLPKVKGCQSVIQNLPVGEQAFCDSVQKFFLSQMNTIPSRKNCENILDLVFTSAPEKFHNIFISSEVFHTDHKLLEFSICTKIERLKKVPRFVYNFKRANFDNIRSVFNGTDFSHV